MIQFHLSGIHPTFERDVIDTLRGLDADFPWGALEEVRLYDREGDRSLGHSDKPGVIMLNGYWFRMPADELRDAAREHDLVYLHRGTLALPWHGGMEEPHHLLAHEFGHQIQNVLPAWQAFATTHWSASCRDVEHQPPVSGYALCDPDEYFAETFAAIRLGEDCEATRMLRDILRSKSASRV